MDLFSQANLTLEFEIGRINGQAMNLVIADKPVDPVSYTHLTLPTTSRV